MQYEGAYEDIAEFMQIFGVLAYGGKIETSNEREK
jgi:hypothetical protein